jgi:hypothetical protein
MTMKDHEAVTLKAFVFALAKQSSPLAKHIQSELNQISTNPVEHIERLDQIAKSYPTITQPYSNACDCLDAAQERNKGRDCKPDASIEKENAETAAIETNIFVKLERSNDKAIVDKTKEILQAVDSVAAAQQFLY